MISLSRIAIRVIAGLSLFVAAVAAGLYLLASFSLPGYSGSERLGELDARVEIVRDAHAVPRVFAKTRHDLFFAMGYVHAMDRLWQMDIARRLAQGRLSERFGSRALSTDRVMRAFDLSGHAARSLDAQSDEARAVLRAYAAGVNARIDVIQSRGLGRGAPEFYFFGGELDPWKPEDSLAVLKTMAFRISQTALFREVKRGRFLLALEPQQVRDLFPEYPGQGVMSLPKPEARPAAEATEDSGDLSPLSGAPGEPQGGGSNAWAVDGAFTASRAPLLASDPHLDLTAPSIWYPIQLSGPGYRTIGASIAGIPAIVTGRNARIAWGITAAQIDDLDVFIERVDPEDPGRYETETRWARFETRTERIRLDTGQIVETEVRRTRHGPVLPSDFAGLFSVTPRDHLPSVAWTALSDDDTSFDALLQLNRAANAAEAFRAAEDYVAPAVNLLVADSRMVGMTLAGRVPLRRLTSKFQGRVPSPGWTEAHDWIGHLPQASLPRVINPASGRVANANNRVGNGTFPRHLSFDWAPPFRINRVRKLLDARETHSVQSFQEMQVDIVSEMARLIAPLIGAGIWDGDESDEDGHVLRREALARLRDWNGAMSEHDPEPLILMAWLDELTEALAADELGDLATSYRGPRPVFVERVFRDIDGAARWCDDIRTEPVEDCALTARRALDAALTRLETVYGPELRSWRWGVAHRAIHRHTTLGGLDIDLFGIPVPLSRLFNIEQEVSGGDYTLNRGTSLHTGGDPFVTSHGAGFRGVYDLADLDRSKFIVTTGTSGHFLSPNYDNLAHLWRAGELLPMSMDRKDIEPGSLGTLTLEPVQTGAVPILP